MNKLARTLMLVLFIPTSLIFAQSNRRTSLDDLKKPIIGTYTQTATLAYNPTSLKDLAEKSEWIVEGQVESVIASRYTNPDIPISMETDIAISVKRIFKGPKDRTIKKVILSQSGGKIGDSENLIKGDVLMEEGETYVLCLTPDTRPNLPDYKAPRYTVLGEWHGKFKLEEGKIKANPYAIFRNYDEVPTDELVAEVLDFVPAALRHEYNTPAAPSPKTNRRHAP